MDIEESTAPGEEYYRLYYRDYAAQNPPQKLAYYRDIAVRFAPSEFPSALDIGCAFGDFLAMLPLAWSKTGIDANAYAIHTAARKHPGISFLQTAGLAFLAEAKFGVVTAFDVLEHLEDLDAALAGIEAALQPGGVLIIVVPVYDGPLGTLVRLLDRDPTHVTKASRSFWKETISRRFAILHHEGLFRLLVPGTRRYVHAHSAALASLSPAILIVARSLF